MLHGFNSLHLPIGIIAYAVLFFKILAFLNYYLLPDPAFAAWTGEQQITPELHKEICQVAAKFLDPDLMVKICERFPGMAAGSHM